MCVRLLKSLQDNWLKNFLVSLYGTCHILGNNNLALYCNPVELYLLIGKF